MRMRQMAGIAALAIAMAACSSSGPGSSATQGAVFRWATTSPIDSLNPFVAVQQNSYYTFQYIYPFLVQYSPGLQVIPDFAQSWRMSAGGRVITFRTRDGARWSDGKPLTARHAAWTINTVVKYQSGPTASEGGAVTGIVNAAAPNATTLVIRYQHPVPAPLVALQGLPILPEHIWGRLAAGKGAQLKTFANAAPIVSGGPFMLVSYTPNQTALFKPNPGWWGPRPHVSGFGIQFFTAADAMILALKNHQIDGTQGEPLPPTAISAVRSPGFAVANTVALDFRDFIINSNPRKTQHRELLNPLVRLAFAHAIDRNQIVRTAWGGYARPGSSVISPAYGAWNNPALHPESFNLTLASQLLDRAGYRTGPGGLRIASGHPMSYTLLFVSDEKGPGSRAFQIIQGDFRKIGVQLNERLLDPSAATSAILGPNKSYHGWALAMWDWSILPADPAFILNALTCSQWGGWSDSGYCNKAYDGLYARQAADMTNSDRISLIRTMQSDIYNAQPYIVLSYDEWTEARASGWAGFVLSPNASLNQLSIQTILSLHPT